MYKNIGKMFQTVEKFSVKLVWAMIDNCHDIDSKMYLVIYEYIWLFTILIENFHKSKNIQIYFYQESCFLSFPNDSSHFISTTFLPLILSWWRLKDLWFEDFTLAEIADQWLVFPSYQKKNVLSNIFSIQYYKIIQ